MQKELFAHYLNEAVSIENGDLDSICALARKHEIAVYLGCAERAGDRGGHSLYCRWITEPIVGKEVVVTATINFNPSGHYSRPDVFELNVNRQRQKLVHFKCD